MKPHLRMSAKILLNQINTRIDTLVDLTVECMNMRATLSGLLTPKKKKP